MEEVGRGGTYMWLNDCRLHCGIRKASSADVYVGWPDVKVDSFSAVAAGQIVTIHQGKGIVRKQPYSPVRP
jgi:hypothetical protein